MTERKMFGFRSGKRWKSVLVVAWIAFWCIAAVILLFEEPTIPASDYDMWLERFAGVFLMIGIAVLPVLLSDFAWLKKIPLLGSDTIWKRIIGIVVFAFVWLILFGCINSAHSEDYQVRYAELIARQEAEEEHARAIREAEEAVKREEAERQAEERRAAEQAEREEAERQVEEARAEQEAKRAADEARRAEEEAERQAEENAKREAEEAEKAEQALLGNLGRALIDDGGFTREEALAACGLLKRVGCGDIEPLADNPVIVNGVMTIIRGKVNGHQVNVTAENHGVFYVQITDISGEQWGWYRNWRGKLVYGIVSDRISCDLYDSDTVEGGYVAWYDAENDRVVPWGER